MAGVSVVVSGPIIGTDIWGTIEREFHLQAPELAVTLTNMVKDITPILTGSLQADVTGIPNPPGDPKLLVWIFPQDSDQLITWGRIYAAYQEGPPQGLDTYTNPPRQMFQKTADGDGLDATELWAMTVVSTGLGLAAAGIGPKFGGGTFGFA